MSTASETVVRYEAVMGLEVHAQLLTESKIFCGCPTTFGAPPNSQTCPVCLGLPGVLPVLNRRAVEMAVLTGLATHCRINAPSRFARKHYFYPDLPKGYQISQYERPLCEGGYLEISVGGGIKRIGIRRIHLEEDAGKNLHEGIDGASHVDLNRAGVPLMEIVSEPEVHTAEEAVAYLKALRDIVVYLGVCDGNMEEGSLRCEPNISIRPVGATAFGTRIEVKNINSFRFVGRAIEYELKRQEVLVRAGGRVVQETRLWNSELNVTAPMRSKEEAHDYRYFPEPDLVPVALSEAELAPIRARLPELPEAKRRRFAAAFELPEYDAEVLTGARALADYFEDCVRHYRAAQPAARPKAVSNWIMTELLSKISLTGREPLDERLRTVAPEHLARLLAQVDAGAINLPTAKRVFEHMWESGGDPDRIIREQGLGQVSDAAALEGLIDRVLAENPKELEQYRQGKDRLLGFFVGQVMKVSGGKANPALLNELLKRKLAGKTA